MNAFDTITDAIVRDIPELHREDLAFAPPPKLEMGDVSLRAFEGAKKLGLKPPQLAARIAQEVSFGPEVAEARPAGPYVNFRLDRGAVGRRITAEIAVQGGAFGSLGLGKGVKALVEHTSINPNASPHVGRARNALIGDSLVRLLHFEAYDVEVHYYVNDMGRQIALLVLVCDDPKRMTFDYMLARYVEANERAKADAEFAEQGYELLVRMEEGDPETKRRFHEVTDLCLQGQVAVLGRLGIHYDHFDRESDFVKDPRLEKVLEALRARGSLFTDEDDRLVVDLQKLGHPYEEGRYFVLMRANGSSMYGCRDLSYTIDKLERGAALNLIVLGEDHKLYAQQLSLILEAAGYSTPEQVYYAYILLKEGKMSTREGNVVLLSEFLDEATQRAAQKVQEQWPDLAPEAQQAMAEQVAIAAVRFAILRVNPTKNVIFEWESALSFSGDTGPYVQYSCTRIASILRKHGESLTNDPPSAFPVSEDAEWGLLLQLAAFPETVSAAAENRAVAPIAQYALETARKFTTFYHQCPVLTAETNELKMARLHLCQATLQVLKNALGILGIEAMERM